MHTNKRLLPILVTFMLSGVIHAAPVDRLGMGYFVSFDDQIEETLYAPRGIELSFEKSLPLAYEIYLNGHYRNLTSDLKTDAFNATSDIHQLGLESQTPLLKDGMNSFYALVAIENQWESLSGYAANLYSTSSTTNFTYSAGLMLRSYQTVKNYTEATIAYRRSDLESQHSDVTLKALWNISILKDISLQPSFSSTIDGDAYEASVNVYVNF